MNNFEIPTVHLILACVHAQEVSVYQSIHNATGFLEDAAIVCSTKVFEQYQQVCGWDNTQPHFVYGSNGVMPSNAYLPTPVVLCPTLEDAIAAASRYLHFPENECEKIVLLSGDPSDEVKSGASFVYEVVEGNVLISNKIGENPFAERWDYQDVYEIPLVESDTPEDKSVSFDLRLERKNVDQIQIANGSFLYVKPIGDRVVSIVRDKAFLSIEGISYWQPLRGRHAIEVGLYGTENMVFRCDGDLGVERTIGELNILVPYMKRLVQS